jgi:hypothetical protein
MMLAVKLQRFFQYLLLALLASGCGQSSQVIRESMDPMTAATVSASSVPLIFYNDNSAYAAHSRNYVYVGPVSINNMGQYRYYLWFGIWGTIPSTPPAAERDGFEAVTIFADGEPLQLSLAGWGANAIGASRPVYNKPVASAADAYYEVTLDQIRLIAEARDLRILTTGSAAYSFELWDGQGSAYNALHAFVERSGN